VGGEEGLLPQRRVSCSLWDVCAGAGLRVRMCLASLVLQTNGGLLNLLCLLHGFILWNLDIPCC
jgi:hypothetical protein